MVDIVFPSNRHVFASTLEEMHRQRYRVLVEGAGWNIPGIKQGYDKDAFDTDETVYLLEIDPQSKDLLASVRFNPTTKPHMMTEVFRHQCEGDVPTGNTIWEGSRYVFEKARMDTETFARTRIIMGIAMTEFCLSQGIKQMTWLTHPTLYRGAQNWWNVRALGAPQYYDSDRAEYVAAISDMTMEARNKLRAVISEDGPVLFKREPLHLVTERPEPSPLAA